MKSKFIILKDKLERFLLGQHPLIPPKRYNYINIGSNEDIGKEFLSYFVTYGDLKPSDYVLEIGSGFGRMAIPLTKYLSHEGSYEGIDILKDGINWCQSNFTKRYPNFKFHKIDVYNARYNPSGIYLPSNFKFPFKDASFDFLYLTSVFTHMYPDAIKNYLKEICRVLKPEAKCFISYYLLNDKSLNNINQNKGTYNFKYEVNDFRIEDDSDPLFQIAFKEELIRKFYENANIRIIEPIHYGSWSGREEYLSFQDIIVGKKK